MAAERFWELRSDVGFDHYFAELDKQLCEVKLIQSPTIEGHTAMRREMKLTLKENPLPPRLRKMMGKSEFTFIVRATHGREHFDEAHPYAYSTEFPVFTERISVTGSQWCEPLTPDTCRLHAKIRLTVSIAVIGPAIEKAVEKSMKTAYKDLPLRALDYIRLDEAELQRWRSMSPPAQPVPAAGVVGSQDDERVGETVSAPSPTEPPSDLGEGGAPIALATTAEPPGGERSPPPSSGWIVWLEAVAGCLAPELVSRTQRAQRTNEVLESAVRSLTWSLEEKERALHAKQGEVEALTTQLQQTILKLKSASEVSQKQTEKLRREQERAREDRAREDRAREEHQQRVAAEKAAMERAAAAATSACGPAAAAYGAATPGATRYTGGDPSGIPGTCASTDHGSARTPATPRGAGTGCMEGPG